METWGESGRGEKERKGDRTDKEEGGREGERESINEYQYGRKSGSNRVPGQK